MEFMKFLLPSSSISAQRERLAEEKNTHFHGCIALCITDIFLFKFLGVLF